MQVLWLVPNTTILQSLLCIGFYLGLAFICGGGALWLLSIDEKDKREFESKEAAERQK